MKVAVIGAGRTNNGIGRFIGNFFQKNGAEVTAVLGTSDTSAGRAAEALENDGQVPRPYTEIETLLGGEPLDIAVIASPTTTHWDYLTACIEAGLHIFCEKPIIDPTIPDIRGRLDRIFRESARRQLTIAMNSQCPFLYPAYETLCGRVSPKEASHFAINLSPMVDGRDMIPDSVPHALSLVYAVHGNGEIMDLQIERGRGQMTIIGTYRTRKSDCTFRIALNRHREQPRPFSFGWNQRVIHRRVTLEPYAIAFQYGKTIRNVDDPLERSVQDFLSAIHGQHKPTIDRDHIVDTTLLLKRIYDHWETSV